MIVIPKFVQIELQRIKEKKPLTVSKRKQYSPEENLTKAIGNLKFLNEIAKTEPICSFLSTDRVLGKILILDHFTPDYPDLVSNPPSGLWLETISGKTGLFYWLDSDYSVYRSKIDHQLVTELDLRKWHPKSIAQFAALTKKEIWKVTKKWLQHYRAIVLGKA
jgi:hypothetical protein